MAYSQTWVNPIIYKNQLKLFFINQFAIAHGGQMRYNIGANLP